MDKSNYMAIEDQTQDLLLEEELGIFKHCENYKYLGVIPRQLPKMVNSIMSSKEDNIGKISNISIK